MPKYLLDTNICIFYMKGRYKLKEKLNSKMLKSCYLSDITVAELYYGAALCNRKEEAISEVEKFLSFFTVIPIFHSLLNFAELKADLKLKGTPIDDFDLLIGATAITNNLILATDNTKHFTRINKLKLENWIKR